MDKEQVLNKIRELILNQHQKMDDATSCSAEIKIRSEGYIEALFQVESLIINWESVET